MIEDKKSNEIREAKTESEQQIRRIRNSVRFVAAGIPPLPPLILGLFVWIAGLAARTWREPEAVWLVILHCVSQEL